MANRARTAALKQRSGSASRNNDTAGGDLAVFALLLLVVWWIVTPSPDQRSNSDGADRAHIAEGDSANEKTPCPYLCAKAQNRWITPADHDMMTRVAIFETRREPRLGKIAVAHVIRNRWFDNPFGWKTVRDVVTACGKVQRGKRLVEVCQFEPWQARRRQLLAVDPNGAEYRRMHQITAEAIEGRTADPTNDAFYFLNVATVKARNGGKLPAAWARIVAQPACNKIGRHTFCPREK